MSQPGDPRDPEALRKGLEEWERQTLAPALERDGERLPAFETQAMHWPVDRLYTPLDLEAVGFDYLKDVGFPGQYPYTRGTRPNGYRSQLWAMKQVTGFGTPEEWAKRARKGKARLDFTQNAINKTLVAPYSARPAPGAPVSVPIAWDELDDPKLRPDRWTIRDLPDRLAEVGDPFAGLLEDRQVLPPLG